MPYFSMKLKTCVAKSRALVSSGAPLTSPFPSLPGSGELILQVDELLALHQHGEQGRSGLQLLGERQHLPQGRSLSWTWTCTKQEDRQTSDAGDLFRSRYLVQQDGQSKVEGRWDAL